MAPKAIDLALLTLVAAGGGPGCARGGFEALADAARRAGDGAADRSGDVAPGADGDAPFVGPCSRRKLTFDNSRSAEDLVDFTVLVLLDADRVDYPGMQGVPRVLFTAADGETRLPFEIEQWDPSGASVVWLRVPRIRAGSSSDHVWMYYGDSVATPSVAGPVWDEHFVGVWHMNERAGGVDAVRDASVRGNHGTSFGEPSFGLQGQRAGAVGFDGHTSYLDMGSDDSLSLSSSGTIEAWVKLRSLTKYSFVVSKAVDGGAAGVAYDLQRLGDGEFALCLSDGVEVSYAATQRTSWSLGTWYYLVGRWDRAQAQMLVDGAIDGKAVEQPRIPQVDASFPLHIGCGDAPACVADHGLDGEVDEVRLSSIARSDDWIAAQHASISDRLITFGDPETVDPP